MEAAISWPGHYLIDRPQQLRAVGAVALARSRDRDIREATRKLRCRAHTIRRWDSEGCDAIAGGLISDNVAVF
jgi:hypothetical protein